MRFKKRIVRNLCKKRVTNFIKWEVKGTKIDKFAAKKNFVYAAPKQKCKI